MNWKIKNELQKTIQQLSEAKKYLPEDYMISHEVKEEEEGESKIEIELINDFKPCIEPLKFEKEFDKISSLDSSTRYLRDISVNLVILGMSVYSNRKGFIDFPLVKDIPYIGVNTYRRILEKINSLYFIKTRNKLNYPFDENYKLDDVADEMRTEAENEGLNEVVNGHDLVILDGPIYPTPLELTEELDLSSTSRLCHQLAYASLVNDRISLLKDNVIGVVKRLENSGKLWKEDKILEEFKKLGKNIKGLKDPTILELIDYYFCRNSGKYSYACFIGPFKIDYNLHVDGPSDCNGNGSYTYLSNVPPKYAYYVILRKPYVTTTYFRIEGLDEKTLEKGMRTVLSRLSDRLIPTFIELVDNRAKRISAGLFITAYEIASSYLSIIHDDKLAYDTTVSEFLRESRQNSANLL
ncbi:DNA double-strand break repair nuclease NurA [Acidianus sp. HS-5]|uniref:DNA double-strand break repair nuclease NurA n=1 Tax=Acidianus sp. HS-5 TaxID=2886040 RepID=UPI001F439B9D|nr:DNA double-strand break repair nuclease NurA [Acidianus sp. HS-5]